MAKSKLEILINAKDQGAKSILGGITGALQNMLSVAGGILAAGALQQIGSAFVGLAKDSIGAASNLAETANKINVVFGDAAGAINEFAAGSATSLGQSTQQALDAAATFGVFGKSAGLAGAGLADFSTDLVGLSSDLASFYNATPEESIEAIGAALRGESEPIRRFGVLLDDATLRAKALELGLVRSTKEALTPQQKVLAAYEVILDQTADAQGDFARTSNGLANSQRIVSAQLENLKAEFGKQFLPVIEKGAQVLSKILIPAGSALLEKFVYPAIPAIADFGGNIIDVFSRLANGSINFQQAIFELFGERGLAMFRDARAFVQPLIDAVSGLFGAVGEDLPLIAETFRGMFDDLVATIDEVAPGLLGNMTGTVQTITQIWEDHGATILSVLGYAWNGAVAVVGGAVTLIGGLIQGLVTIVSGAMDGFSLVFQGKFAEAFQNSLTTINTFGGILGAAWQTIMTLALSIVGMNLDQFNAMWANNFAMLSTIISTWWTNTVTVWQTNMAAIAQAIATGVAQFMQIWNSNFAMLAAIVQAGLGAAVAAVTGTIGQFVSAGQSIIDGLRGGIEERLGALMEWVRGVASELADIIAGVAAAGAAVGSALGVGGGGGGDDNRRAGGGPVSANTPYLVGEQGPEMFVPSRSGTIIPNDQLAGAGGGMVFNISVVIRGSATEADVRSGTRNGVVEALRAAGVA